MSQCTPSRASSKALTSCFRNTTGRRWERLARTTLSIQPRGKVKYVTVQKEHGVERLILR